MANDEQTPLPLSQAELRRLVTEGRDSGPPVDGETALRRLLDKYAAMAKTADR